MNIAFFADLNTVDTEGVAAALRDAASSGTILTKNAYGAFDTTPEQKGPLEKAGIYIVETPHSYKDRTPAEIIIDIMNATDNINIEEIYLVTGDAYLLPVIRRALSKGKRITVAGTSQAAGAYIPLCSRFRFIEILTNKVCDGPFTDTAEIKSCIFSMLLEGKAKGTATPVCQIYDRLCSLYPEFDMANYGYSDFEAFAASLTDSIMFKTENGELMARLINNREDVEDFIYSFLSKQDNKINDMEEMFEALRDEFPDFSIMNYGYRTDIGFIMSFPKLEIYNNKGVKLKQSFKLK